MNNKMEIPSLSDYNYFIFSKSFNPDSCTEAMKFILERSFLPPADRPSHITMVINSPGGEVNSAFALIDTMKSSRVPVHTIGVGCIASCGLLTFMAGTPGHRLITPNTSILSHQYSWGTVGKEHELFAAKKEFDLTTDRMITHYEKCTGLKEKQIRKLLLPPHDVWLTAEEAVEYNIADRIVETY